jgi:hypothetical protein
LACKQIPRTSTQVYQQNAVHGVVLSNNYDAYLAQIIALQQKFPITKLNVLRCPVKVHVVNPLMGNELKKEDFS